MRAKTIEVLRIEIAKMCLEPDEILVVRFSGAISSEEATHTAEVIRQMLPKTKLLVGSHDVGFSTISQKILCEDCREKV